MPKKVLIITYYWPPGGGAGVQRWLKFVKYLPEFGWEPVVYVPENPEYTAIDHSLEKDIPDGTEILKTKVWEPYDVYKKFVRLKKEDKINSAFVSEKKKPKLTENLAIAIRGNFFIPDARKFWVKPSVKFIMQYLKKNPVDLIVSTGPPHSMHLIAHQLKQITGLPWIADFRDPWTQISYYRDLKLLPWADKKHKQLEKKMLAEADQVMVVSEGMKQEFDAIFSRDYQVIPNGFDEDDIPKGKIIRDKKFSIAHIGSLATSRNPAALWEALKQIDDENAGFSEQLEIKLAGKVDINVLDMIKSYGLEKNLTLISYLSHDKVIEEQHKSAVLLLLIHDTPKAGLILTGKLFEYLSAKRPILCIGPEDGDAAKIISKTQSGATVNRDNTLLIKQQILRFYNDFVQGTDFNGSTKIERYSRKALTGQLSQIMDQMI
ncbi:MAG: glycosyltransferase family 4 protein [Bacteroidales bacterium]|nr:glycosyltransferase family 4 protein [Bacteroidales bacterium]